MTVTHLLGPLFTDFYELTMAAGYFNRRCFVPATFSLFIRDYPPGRNYFVAAGLQDALAELESYRFAREDVAYLKETGDFRADFLAYLERLRFTGQVMALPEGTVFFADEPILEVTAPLVEAQIVETFLINTIGLQTMIATKAARCVQVAGGRPLIDFSLRRTQGHDAGLKVARSTYLAGFSGTSNVIAGREYGIPVSGTMAHSFVQAFGGDVEAFTAFAETFPDTSVFLIDTYDTLDGARAAARVGHTMKKNGHDLKGVRLDSGDMVQLSRDVRQILDAAGLPEVKIFASSGFDEFKIKAAIDQGALIDAFGVGTSVGVSADAPFIDIVYKMVRCDGRDVQKLSPGKMTLAGKKQIFREYDEKGFCRTDTIGLRSESLQNRVPMLEPVMQNGRLVRPHPALGEIRERLAQNLAALPDRYKDLDATVPYPVDVSLHLQQLQEKLALDSP
ncbi:MAG: nicotinate phosphoribosyltransferase [Desulfobacterales bacterium]